MIRIPPPLRILDFFAQVYRNDADFARRVDAAVTRILAQKFRMYDLFAACQCVDTSSGLANLGSSQQVMFEVARNAATLINPDPQELSTVLPAPPNQGDRIVFLTDTSSYKQCGGCLQYDAIASGRPAKSCRSLVWTQWQWTDLCQPHEFLSAHRT